jgi:3-oxoacyl-[acyl-carrier-protein] synthase II
VTCGLRAVFEAVASASLDLAGIDPYRVAVHTATGQTGLDVEEFFPALSLAWADDPTADFARLGGRPSRLVDPHFSLRTLSNACLALIAADLDARGPSCNYVQGELATIHAVRAALHDLREGRADVAVVAACDSLVFPSTWLAYERQGLVSPADPARAHAPFDRARDGLVLGEGAAALVLEREERAAARRQPVLARLTAATAAGPRQAMWSADADALRALLEATEPAPALVCARGLATVPHDAHETAVLQACLPALVPVTALKGATGYLGAATMLVETALAVRALREGVVPAVAHLVDPDPECRVSLAQAPRRIPPDAARTAVLLGADWAGRWGAITITSGGVESGKSPSDGSES